MKAFQKGKLEIDLPNEWNSNHTLKISALDKKGDLINTWSYPVQQASKISLPTTTNKGNSEVNLTENKNEYLQQRLTRQKYKQAR